MEIDKIIRKFIVLFHFTKNLIHFESLNALAAELKLVLFSYKKPLNRFLFPFFHKIGNLTP